MWETIRERWEAFSIEQKISVVILGISGVFAIGLSLYRLRESVKAPFLVNEKQILATKKLLGPSKAQIIAKQKRTDTDGDGLSDYDEEHVFHTNPNLRDTCGDGIPDNIRVLTGKNLNCADKNPNVKGFIDLSHVTPTTSTQSVQPAGFGFSGLLNAVNKGSAAQTSSILKSSSAPTNVAQSLSRDPTAIRAALKGSVPQATLNAMSDAQILKVYDQAMVQYSKISANAAVK